MHIQFTTIKERPNSVGAPKLYEGSAQTRKTELISSLSLAGAPELYNSDNVSMRDPHCEVMLSGRTSHTRVESISFFVLDWICWVGMVIYHR